MLLSSFCFLTGTMSELPSPCEGTCVREETVRSFVDRQNLTCSEDIRIEMGSGIEGQGWGGWNMLPKLGNLVRNRDSGLVVPHMQVAVTIIREMG